METALAATSERKPVTVLFADLVGFTDFSYRTDAEEVREDMTRLWNRVDQLIAVHGGSTEKHMGDAVIGLFGGRQAREEDPAQAVRAGLAIQEFLREFSFGHSKTRLLMRVGIHTGLVVVGPLGSTGEFAATGSPVNLASRLQAAAAPGSVLISHETYRQVHGLFELEALPPLRVKGLPEPLQTYSVLRVKPRYLAQLIRRVEGVETEMVGRDVELRRLQNTFMAAQEEKEFQLVTVAGEAGIGKSCLMREFRKWVDLKYHSLNIFSARATAETSRLPYVLLRDAIWSRFDIQESDSPQAARSKLEQGLIAWLDASRDLPTWPDEEPEVQAHFIGHLLGLDYSESPHLKSLVHDAQQIRQRAFHYLNQMFLALGHGLPGCETRNSILLVVDDIHWADDGSLDLLDHLARNCPGIPMMMVCLTRPILFERRPGWGEGIPGAMRVNLEHLSRRDSRSLVDSILRKAREIPQALRELVVSGAEGVPFYIEEIIKMLIDQRVIVPGDEEWQIEPLRLAAARVPPTLTGILQARMDSLTANERLVLQRASVVGRVFWDSAVEALNPDPQPSARASLAEVTVSSLEIEEALAGLRRKELIFRRELSAFQGTAEFTFKHELLRSVCYDSMLKRARRTYHAQVAAWLIQRSGARVTEHAGLVALNFELAGSRDQAAEWHGRSGQQALASYSPKSATEHLRKALSLVNEAEMQVEDRQRKLITWKISLAEALGAQALFKEATMVWHEVLALSADLNDPLTEARACNGLAFLNEREGKFRASIGFAEKAEALARSCAEPGRKELIRALHLKGWSYFRLADARATLAMAEETMRLCGEFRDEHGLATSLKLHGVGNLQLGNFRAADHFFNHGLELSRHLGDRRNSSAMLSNLGESARLRGDARSAAGYYEKALVIARQIGHRESELIYLNNLCGALVGMGEAEQAENTLRQLISHAADPRAGTLAESYQFLAEACLGQEKILPALEAVSQSIMIGRRAECNLELGGAWRAGGRALAKWSPELGELPKQVAETLGPCNTPERCFAESRRIFEQIKASAELARTLIHWAEFERKQGRLEAADSMAGEANRLVLELGMKLELPH